MITTSLERNQMKICMYFHTKHRWAGDYLCTDKSS